MTNQEPMRVLAEPPAPLDEEGELQLDSELQALAGQLTADAAGVFAAAGDRGEVEQAPELVLLGQQLTRDARRVVASAAAAPAARRRPGWMHAMLRIAPVAAAAAAVWMLALPPAAPRPLAAPTPPAASAPEVRETSHTLDVPWDQLSSPELEGVLDLVDGPAQISI